MLIARAVASACLIVLKWMLWLVAVLLLVLILAQYLRGEPGEALKQMTGAGVAAAMGWLCGYLSKRFSLGA